MQRQSRGRRLADRLPREVAYFIAIALGALVLSQVIPDFRAYEWSLWAVYGILALSFTFVWGHAGIFSFGQAAFFGIGAYAYGVAGINLSPTTGETLSALLIGAAVAAAAAGLLGYFIFYGNVGDVYVAIITLAVTLVLLTFMSSTADPKYRVGDAPLGGYNGMAGIPPIMYGSGVALDTAEMLIFCVAAAAGIALSVRILLRRPFGRILAGVRENELRTQLLGYDVRRYKLLAFSLAGAIAGFAGGLYAAWGMFINPSVFSLQQAAMVAIWVLVGGKDSLLGAFAGVAIVQGLSSALGGSGGSWTPIVLGVVLIGVVLLLPKGVVPSIADAVSRVMRRKKPQQVPTTVLEAGQEQRSDIDLEGMLTARTGRVAAQSIRGENLTKRFGGVHALNGVDIDVPDGTVRALIGPNGAGKSTCFNLLVGRYAPTSGRVYLGDDDITKLRSDTRARRGLGIKMQVPSYYHDLSVDENMWLASYAAVPNVKGADEQAARALRWIGMQERAALPASALSHGEHQWLEIGMVVAGSPSVMLLDEPTAGMSRDETHHTVAMINAVSRYSTVVVVEHDMEFLRDLDAPVTMFHQGLVFASGSIEELRQDERVLDTYLGRGVSADVAG
ncbi:MAG: ATP-binding cassette domain-containing protein [Nocardioidaceae bacterium]|nr:ATP-binding cassette domain-containing protein [Nocardioidaceae bacterium]